MISIIKLTIFQSQWTMVDPYNSNFQCNIQYRPKCK